MTLENKCGQAVHTQISDQPGGASGKRFIGFIGLVSFVSFSFISVALYRLRRLRRPEPPALRGLIFRLVAGDSPEPVPSQVMPGILKLKEYGGSRELRNSTMEQQQSSEVSSNQQFKPISKIMLNKQKYCQIEGYLNEKRLTSYYYSSKQQPPCARVEHNSRKYRLLKS